MGLGGVVAQDWAAGVWTDVGQRALLEELFQLADTVSGWLAGMNCEQSQHV